MTELHPAALARLIRSIAVLALPAPGQIAWLRSLGMGEPEYVDELAYELEAGAVLVNQFQALGWISDRLREAVIDIDLELDRFSGPENERLWTVESLYSAPEWMEIRGRAGRALADVV